MGKSFVLELHGEWSEFAAGYDHSAPLGGDASTPHKSDLALQLEARVNEAPQEEEMEDDHLRLIFTCCHPALPSEGQVALTLREVCGLTTEEIARHFSLRRRRLSPVGKVFRCL